MSDQYEKIQKLTAQLNKDGFDAAIFNSPAGVFYSTGFSSINKASGNTGGVLSVVTASGDVFLVVGEFEKLAAQETADPTVSILSYPVWIFIEDYSVPGMTKEVQPSDFAAIDIVSELLHDKLAKGSKVGIQTKWLNLRIGEKLKDLSDYELSDVEATLTEARVIKTPDEVSKLRFNARAAEVAMNQTARALVPGMTTRDVHYLFEKFTREIAKDATEVGHFHTTGSHFSPYWDYPEFPIRRGDVVRLDGGPITYGYKSDLARTFAVGGEVSEDKKAVYRQLWNGYSYGVEHIKPGVRMSDIFRGIDETIHLEDHGYVRGHYGHAISCGESGEEAPFIAPNEDRVFEPGMVMCLETPFYSSKYQTFNIEDTFVVTDDGVDFFTHASPSLLF